MLYSPYSATAHDSHPRFSSQPRTPTSAKTESGEGNNEEKKQSARTDSAPRAVQCNKYNNNNNKNKHNKIVGVLACSKTPNKTKNLSEEPEHRLWKVRFLA